MSPNDAVTAPLCELFSQIDSCNFQCEAGPLSNNVAYVELQRRGFGRPPEENQLLDLPERMLRWFDNWGQVPDYQRDVAELFANMAKSICTRTAGGPERTVALRKLLESRDAALRALVDGG